jgi:hypothetical protein
LNFTHKDSCVDADTDTLLQSSVGVARAVTGENVESTAAP